MTLGQLKEVMKYHLKNFNDEGVDINYSTVHNKVLSENDGFENVNSIQIYQHFIKWTLNSQGLELKEWPENWIDLTVNELSEKLM